MLVSREWRTWRTRERENERLQNVRTREWENNFLRSETYHYNRLSRERSRIEQVYSSSQTPLAY